MLNKLGIPNPRRPENEADLPEEELKLLEEDPIFVLNQAWEFVLGLYYQYFEQIRFNRRRLRNIKETTNAELDITKELEAILRQDFPDLIEALNNLDQALNGLKGWHITWIHWRSGMFDPKSEEELAAASPKLGDYHINKGWITGAVVDHGYEFQDIQTELSVWLHITDESKTAIDTQRQRSGIGFHLADIYILSLTPPLQP